MKSIIWSLMVLLVVSTANLFAAGGDMGGSGQDGSADYPYLIEDFNDFEVFCDDPNFWKNGVHVKLMADIDLAPTLTGRKIYTSAVIAPDTDLIADAYQGQPYLGHFDGNGYAIRNMTIDASGNDACFLALFGCSVGNFTDIVLEDVSITGGANSSRLGALSGESGWSIVTGCLATGKVLGQDEQLWVGGLFGLNHNISVSECSFSGEITGGNCVGGLIGYNNPDSTVSDCFADVEMTCKGDVIGGFVGSNEGVIDNCHSSGLLTAMRTEGESYNAGGFAGENLGSILNSYSTVEVDGQNSVGGLVGYNVVGDINSCHSSGNVQGSHTVGGLVGCNDCGIVTDCNSNGEVTCSEGSAGGLLGSNCFGSVTSCYSSGFVSCLDYDAGGLIGYNDCGDVDSCYSSSNVQGNHSVGGLVGYTDCGNITSCNSSGEVTGSGNSVGGLVGNSHCSSIANCYSSGFVSCLDNDAGGLIGYNTGGDIESCYSSSNVEGNRTVGGFVGMNNYGTITNCYSRGACSCVFDSIGGFAGGNYNGNIINCYSTGACSYVSENMGGLVGWSSYGNIDNCFWDVNTSGVGISGDDNYNATGKTTVEMQTESTFTDAGWDFEFNDGNEAKWYMPTDDYPQLYWQFVPAYGKPKNVILMITDGAGFNAFEAASYYQHGQLGQQVYDSFDVKIACTTYKLLSNGKPQGYDPVKMWSDFNYVRINPTDSSAAATAINSGVKTYTSAVNVNFNKRRLRTASEILEDIGKSTGAVTSVYFSHATPACVAAHNVYRNNYGQIANEMIYDSGLDVIMGCGEGSGNNFYVGGNDTWADILDADGANRFEYIADKNDFAMIADSNYIDQWPDKVLGICHATSTLSNNPANVPTLATMSVGALNVLSKNENGFYVMIEGGAVDWENHARNIEGMIREQVGFNEAVEAVVDWIEDNGGWDKNLLMVTSDHECGMIWGPNTYTDVNDTGLYVPGVDTFNDWNHVVNNGEGNIPGVQYGHTYHTNALVPFYAKGAGSEIFAELVRGNDSNAGEFWNFSGDYIDNTDIFNAMYSLCVNIPLDFENHDGLVNFKEYAAMINAYQSHVGDWNWNGACDISEPADGVIDIADCVVLADNWLGNFMSCDFNFDYVVDGEDYAIMFEAWNTSPGMSGWNPACDVGLPKDDYIDEKDLAVLADN